MRLKRPLTLTAVLGAAPLLMSPIAAQAATVANPLCPAETAIYAPGHAQDIVVPSGFRVSVFARGLNAPTGIAFQGNKNNFKVYVLESGHGIPSRCNEQGSFGTGTFDPINPFTADVLVFDKFGNKIAGPLFKPTGSGTTQTGGLQAAGPSVDIAFENGFAGGRLFATDSNQATHAGGQNNSSRIVILNLATGKVNPFITNLPTGDHPSEQLAFKGGWIYWSQGSTTNSGVVGRDNGGGYEPVRYPVPGHRPEQ
jgi:glucose/arabinose dehydrogenase